MNTLETNLEEAIGMLRSLAELREPLEKAVAAVRETLTGGGRLYTCGNGGSAADASHFATEFLCRFKGDRGHFPAMTLAGDTGLVTAMANDFGFDEIFARQLRGLGRPGDLLAVFSTSGQSTNIRLALEEARQIGMKSLAFLGRDGGPCRGLADIELIVASQVTARIQEGHLFLYHTICEAVEPALQGHP